MQPSELRRDWELACQFRREQKRAQKHRPSLGTNDLRCLCRRSGLANRPGLLQQLGPANSEVLGSVVEQSLELAVRARSHRLFEFQGHNFPRTTIAANPVV